MNVHWQVILSTIVEILGISFEWSVLGWGSGNLQLVVPPAARHCLRVSCRDSGLLLNLSMAKFYSGKELSLGDLSIFSWPPQ